MKKRKEGFLDFLYNAIDYMLILVIFLIIVVIVTWKLDLLLNGNVSSPASSSIIDRSFVGSSTSKSGDEKNNTSNETGTPPVEENSPEEKGSNTPNTPNEPTIPAETAPTTPQHDPNPTPSPTPPTTGTEEKVFIPDGISAYKIGEILVEKGFIASAQEFNDRAVEIKLDRRMQTGYFMIPKGASLDEIIKIICKVKN